MKWRAILIFWISFDWAEVSAHTSFYNLSEVGNLTRNKRFLIYEGGGNRKFTCGFTVPVDLGDTRSLALYFNFQGQYLTPPTPIYWWDKWNERSLKDLQDEFGGQESGFQDESRVFIYSLIEFYLDRLGRDGRKCLLRAICENAMVDETYGVWSKIMNKILTPAVDSKIEYRDAYKAGQYGAVCITMYPECPVGQGLLDGLTHTEVTQYLNRH